MDDPQLPPIEQAAAKFKQQQPLPSIEEAARAFQSQQPAKTPTPEPAAYHGGKAGSAIAGAAAMVPFANKILAGLSAASGGDGTFGDRYEAAKTKLKTGETAAHDENPWSYRAGELGSAVATGGLLPEVKGVGLASRLARSAAGQGAAYGALQGASDAEGGVGDYAKKIAGDAAFGAAAGPLLGGIARPFIKKGAQAVEYGASKLGLGNAASAAADVVTATGKNRRALSDLTSQTNQSGKTLEGLLSEANSQTIPGAKGRDLIASAARDLQESGKQFPAAYKAASEITDPELDKFLSEGAGQKLWQAAQADAKKAGRTLPTKQPSQAPQLTRADRIMSRGEGTNAVRDDEGKIYAADREHGDLVSSAKDIGAEFTRPASEIRGWILDKKFVSAQDLQPELVSGVHYKPPGGQWAPNDVQFPKAIQDMVNDYAAKHSPAEVSAFVQKLQAFNAHTLGPEVPIPDPEALHFMRKASQRDPNLKEAFASIKDAVSQHTPDLDAAIDDYAQKARAYNVLKAGKKAPEFYSASTKKAPAFSTLNTDPLRLKEAYTGPQGLEQAVKNLTPEERQAFRTTAQDRTGELLQGGKSVGDAANNETWQHAVFGSPEAYKAFEMGQTAALPQEKGGIKQYLSGWLPHSTQGAAIKGVQAAAKASQGAERLHSEYPLSIQQVLNQALSRQRGMGTVDALRNALTRMTVR